MSEKTAKLADVAKAAGVSQGTASNVFNRPEVVREEVRERVLAAARKIGYGGPDPKGRLLRAGKVNAIGIGAAEPLSYFFDDPFARTVMASIAQECDSRGAGIALISALNNESVAWNIQSALVDGLILFCAEGADKLIELARDRQIPFVAIESPEKLGDLATITIDNFAGGRLAAEHLVALGHRRFGILALPFNETGSGPRTTDEVRAALYDNIRDRALGYFSVLADQGIAEADVPLFETRDRETVFAALDTFYAAAEPPTALLCMSDVIALDALAWLRSRGHKVPEDVSVVGFDGVPEAALSDPPLTTIEQPLAEMGRMAVQIVMAPTRQTGNTTADLQLVERGSTGPAKG
ncbi:LacI family transcriptional regulator [Youhaiella tibetensis]|uniref:Substrate-binding domain-containing protein n=1 Tax=Paradevosia tibetensis TaxID=1447062 RepID=A0A5B9DM01_9HYPH|nr:LacI family DNA-binding transcriptional regulator [Youhaiella tibetensis]QEE20361.1 substrate-binding domain-containing protein [Youhaiella tibetensis]GGF24885.1 LacI family transcriptional regulator [Youhaiella tibetensis]